MYKGFTQLPINIKRNLQMWHWKAFHDIDGNLADNADSSVINLVMKLPDDIFAWVTEIQW